MKKLFLLAATFVITTWLGGMNTMYCYGNASGTLTENGVSTRSVDKSPTIKHLSEEPDGLLKCIEHKWEYLYVRCTTIHGKPAYCFELVVYGAKECEKFKYSIAEPVVPNSVSWWYDNQGNLHLKGCFWKSGSTNPLCVKINFADPICCDIEACVKLPQCCEEKKWEGKIRCDEIDGQKVYCYQVVIADAKECDGFTFDLQGTSVTGPTITYDAAGNATITGCVLASSLPNNAEEWCFKVDFKNPKCCDFKGCLKLPECCEDKRWKGKIKCDEINGKKVYCYQVVIADAKECDGFKFDLQGTSVTGPTITYDAAGNATITGCVLASSLPNNAEEWCFKVNFKNPKCCDFKGCLKLPECCEKKHYEFLEYECYVKDGKKILCFEFVVKDAKECEKFEYEVNATTVEGPSFSYDANGHLHIKHCVTDIQGEQFCLGIDWISDLCCDLKACKKLPECVGAQDQIHQRSQKDIEDNGTLFEVMPIPADNYLKVKIKEHLMPSVIVISDINHKEVFKTAPTSKELSIYTGGFASGVYLISLYDLKGKQLGVKKVQITHQ